MILYIRNTTNQAKHLAAALGLSQDECMAAGIGNALTGHRFDKIIIDVDSTKLSKLEKEHYTKWLDQALATKLKPNGKTTYIQ